MEILQPQAPIFNVRRYQWATTEGFNPMLMNVPSYVPGPRSARKRDTAGPEIVSIKRRKAPAEPDSESVSSSEENSTPAPATVMPPTPLETNHSLQSTFQPIQGNPYGIATAFSPNTYFGALTPTPSSTRPPLAPPSSVEVVLDDGQVATPLKRINLSPESLEFTPLLRKQLRRSTPVVDIPPSLVLPPSPTALIPRPDSSSLFPLPTAASFPTPKPRTWSIEEVIEDEEDSTNSNTAGAQSHQQPTQSQVMSVD